MGWNNKQVKQRTNIVSLRMDAAFFFERAVQSLDKFHYERALKYFRKAAELEPSTINHCNLAGVLSEMGYYEESNDVLQHILDSIEPNMTECYFYMANNYANMDQFERSEQALIDYLEQDEEIHFIEECKEMMELLSYELKRPVDFDQLAIQGGRNRHDQAQNLLEQGMFLEATQLLEQLVAEEPGFLAAQNNLALAYYCLGDYAQCKKAVIAVLNKDPGNVHALCNLAIYYLHQNEQKELSQLVSKLSRIYPYHVEHNYKLAMTFAMLEEHKLAYERFKRLIQSQQQQQVVTDAALYHYTAVAACHLGKLHEAENLWKQVAKIDPNSYVSAFYLNRITEMDQRNEINWEEWELSYYYHPPFEYSDYLGHLQTNNIEVVRNDPLIRASFFWALHHGDDQTKRQVIEVLALIGGEQIESVLRDYLMKPGESKALKNLAIYALKTMGAEEPLKAIIDEKEIAVYSLPLNARLPRWEDCWQGVIDLALQNMKLRGTDIVVLHDLQTLWIEFLSKVYPDTPRIVKQEGWAAALEYLTAKMHNKSVTYRELAEQYNVSEATISKNVKRMDAACGLQEKMEVLSSTLQNKL